MLNGMPTFMLEGVDQLVEIALVKAFAHYDISPWDVVVAVEVAAFASQGFGMVRPQN